MQILNVLTGFVNIAMLESMHSVFQRQGIYCPKPVICALGQSLLAMNENPERKPTDLASTLVTLLKQDSTVQQHLEIHEEAVSSHHMPLRQHVKTSPTTLRSLTAFKNVLLQDLADNKSPDASLFPLILLDACALESTEVKKLVHTFYVEHRICTPKAHVCRVLTKKNLLC